jgi:tripeptidyl-peptidase I
MDVKNSTEMSNSTEAEGSIEALSHVFMEGIPKITSRVDLRKKKRVGRGYIHEVIFMIQPKNVDELMRTLDDVSDPKSVNYGQHLTRQEVTELTANPDSRDAILAYLAFKNVTAVEETLNGDYITASAPISTWENMFNNKFFMFQQTQVTGDVSVLVRAEKYSLPAVLSPHVMHVLRAVDIPLVTRKGDIVPEKFQKASLRKLQQENLRKKFNAQSDLNVVTPQKIKDFYNVTDHVGSSQSTQALYASGGQNFSPKDLTKFQQEYGLLVQSPATVGGYTNDTLCVMDPSSCGESNIDVQYIMAASPVSPTTLWYFPGDFTDWLIAVANTPNPPLVLSISYGSQEALVTSGDHDAFDIQAMKLGVMGVTIVVASGDDGANSYTARTGLAGCGYQPEWPCSSPYVVSVGGTGVRTVRYCESLTSFLK